MHRPRTARGLPSPLRVGVAALALCAGTLAGGATRAETLDRTVHAMGTRLSIHVAGPDRASLARATETAVREVERIEAACSTWRADSDWSRLNASAGGPGVPLANEWIALLGTARDWSVRTGGAFDPVLGALVQAWGLRRGGRTPDAEALARARAASGAALLELDATGGTARLTAPGAAIEEGGFVKGYALDRMATHLREAGVGAAVLDFGGQVLVFGEPDTVAIASPEDRTRAVGEVELADASLSASGTSEHGRHILDPRTGERSPAWGSVSVVAADGLTADVLSTALYVMGPARGLAWARAHHVAALFQVPGRAPAATPDFPKLRRLAR